MTVFVDFRGDELLVVVDQVIDEPDVNAFSIEWHFDGMSPEQHEALAITPEEDHAILMKIEASLDRE